ncbi:MAG: hypothetical protein M3Y48_17215 [Actinomycetota bacterium]|nr:hypothetical protein [Actinomycetota bacterium]
MSCPAAWAIKCSHAAAVSSVIGIQAIDVHAGQQVGEQAGWFELRPGHAG